MGAARQGGTGDGTERGSARAASQHCQPANGGKCRPAVAGAKTESREGSPKQQRDIAEKSVAPEIPRRDATEGLRGLDATVRGTGGEAAKRRPGVAGWSMAPSRQIRHR